MDNTELTQLLDEFLKYQHEAEWLEFKENNNNPYEIGEYISAIANAACLHDRPQGYLIYGIEDQTHSVKGTTFKPKLAKKGNEELENWLVRNLNPRIDFKIHELSYHDKLVIVFIIDATQNQPVSFNGSSYIRVGSYKKKLADYPEKERKIWNKSSKKHFEKQRALNDLNSNEVLQLLDCKSYFHLMHISSPPSEQDILNKLSSAHLIERTGNHYNILNLGAILLANNLNNFPTVKRKALRIIHYKENDRLNTLKERQGTKGYAIAFPNIISYIIEQLPQNEIINQALRQEVKMYPSLAIREIVANALIHQDFNEVGTGPMVEIFKDRIEITNPGKPLINTLRFIDHNPQSRNEILASFMRDANICEERGSGIDKVIASVEAYQLPAPNFVENDNYIRVTLYGHRHLNKMDKDNKIRACYQHCCLRYVMGEYATNSSLRNRFQIEEKNYSIISRIIADTIQAGLIRAYDPSNKAKKHSKYVPFWA